MNSFRFTCVSGTPPCYFAYFYLASLPVGHPDYVPPTAESDTHTPSERWGGGG